MLIVADRTVNQEKNRFPLEFNPQGGAGMEFIIK